MRSSGLKRLAVALALTVCAAAASAQYVWLDEKGLKQYSDQPPPASIPNRKILKSPGGTLPAGASTQSTEDTGKEGDTTKKAPPTTAELNADFLKRRAQQAEKDKQAEAAAKLAADNNKNCEQSKKYLRVLESGERISSMDNAGERVYLSDDERAQKILEVKRTLTDCK